MHLISWACCTLVKCVWQVYTICERGVTMPKYTEAKKKANKQWDSQNLDRISLAVPKGEKDKIKAYADSKGESVNGFIQRAINEAMSEDLKDAIALINHIEEECKIAQIHDTRVHTDWILDLIEDYRTPKKKSKEM